MPTPDLIDWIHGRIAADEDLADEVGLLVLAALEGDDELDGYLSGDTRPRVAVTEPVVSGQPTKGVFLRAVEVTGFRGIGPKVTLELEPLPGLTVVAGRNGSGKSSLAEGLEIVLTGGTYRFKNKKSTQWAERWRNIHHDGASEVVAQLVEEGAGPLRLCTRWPAGSTTVSDHTTTAQSTVAGIRGPERDVTSLNWTSALETYRPLLSYDELGGLLESGPSELYDAIAKVLGTEQLAHALTRIKNRLGTLSDPVKASSANRRTLQSEAAALPDERADRVATLLKRPTPDTRAIRAVATGLAVPDHGLITSLRDLAQLSGPDATAVIEAATRLRSAVSAMAVVGEAEAEGRAARLEVRRRAMHLHQQYGDQTCPVCSQGTLDQEWAEQSRHRISREDKELAHLSAARSELESSRAALCGLVSPRPTSTDKTPLESLRVALDSLRTEWDSFSDSPQADLDAADHAELHAQDLEVAVLAVRQAALAEIADRDDAWSPLATQIVRWCDTWDAATSNKPMIDQLTAAEKWLKENDTRLKNERLAPISEQARHAWSLLRQESNVDLGDLRLEGQATRRRVSITASIDGTDAGSALPVMSQGELHALALALFLPRATLDESPFRFIVLDDPVQAMDPAKVDGLVALLCEIAQTRQVVVFSHDDRLPSALRRTDASARVYEVARGPRSSVSVSSAQDPTTRYLDDADALCRDSKVPDETLRRTLPGLLRMAVESAARDRFYATRISRGETLTEVESAWNEAQGTSQRVSLALHDKVTSLDGWLRTDSRRKGLGVATSGFHKGLYAGTHPRDAVSHVRQVVQDVRAGSK